MRCIVSAGPTFEPMDQVRRLTNFSTGTLGTELANALADAGHSVVLLKGYYSVTERVARCPSEVFSTAGDLEARFFERRTKDRVAVFHAAAVGDFRVSRVWTVGPDGSEVPVESGKVSTDLGILRAELRPTSKILVKLRMWFPNSFLAGWKYEVDGGPEEALEKGRRQLATNQSDICVVNGPAYGPGFCVLDRHGRRTACGDRAELTQRLLGMVAPVSD